MSLNQIGLVLAIAQGKAKGGLKFLGSVHGGTLSSVLRDTKTRSALIHVDAHGAPYVTAECEKTLLSAIYDPEIPLRKHPGELSKSVATLLTGKVVKAVAAAVVPIKEGRRKSA